MQTEEKIQIISALETYMELHGISQNEIAKKADVNASYLVNMRKGVFASNNNVEFADKYFQRLANLIGFQLSNTTIGTKLTRQFNFILSNLVDAREHTETTVLVGETGAGKTYTIDVFKTQFTDIFSVKIGSSDTLNDLLNKIGTELKLDFLRALKQSRCSKSTKIGYICRKLAGLRDDGRKPILIFDEAEYMKHAALCAYKEIYDVLLDVCPTVLIGTSELTANIDKLILKNKPGIAQLFRRIKFKIKNIPPINSKFELFLDGIEPELQKWLITNCNNYGELTDVLKPCIRESQRLDRALSLRLVCLVLNLDYETERNIRR
ncbi:MAG: ATP-binding protein [Flavobacteriales bacterium]|nr:MAG: ATP-binding protein [Flavobacteriales bacterium]